MIKEIFKKQICITQINETDIEFSIRLAAKEKDIEEGALNTVLKSDKNYLFQPTDKLFFLSGCTVPRFKVKQLCEASGMTTVKAIENSTVVIYGDDTEKSVTRFEWGYYNVPKGVMLNFIDKNYPIGQPNLLKLKEMLDDPETFHTVNVSRYNDKNIMEGYQDWVSFPIDKKAGFHHEKVWVTEEKKINEFDKMLEDGYTLVHQNDLLCIININNIMDKEMYQETCKMFESQDQNNHVLAIEIMANCDYEKSALYLFLLIKEYRSEIYNRQESKHVNYQSLCKFFNIKRDHNIYDVEDLIEELSERNLLSSKYREEIYNLMIEESKDRLGNSFYEVTKITANEKMEKAFQRGDLYLDGKDIPEELLDKKEDDDDEEVDSELEEIEDDNEQL